MYNRYIPQPDGSYRRNQMQDPTGYMPPKSQPQKETACPPSPPKPAPQKQLPNRSAPRQYRRTDTGVDQFLRQLLPKDFDTGDLLVILLLLLMAGDCPEDRNNAILTIALYFLM